jgi:hypothetical protein
MVYGTKVLAVGAIRARPGTLSHACTTGHLFLCTDTWKLQQNGASARKQGLLLLLTNENVHKEVRTNLACGDFPC